MAVKIEKQGDVAIVVMEGNFFGGKETDALEKAFKELPSKVKSVFQGFMRMPGCFLSI